MFQVVGVLPDVDAVNGGSTVYQRGVLVREGFNEKFTVFAATEPSPTASEDTHRAFGHFFLPLFITSKSIVDLLSQFALRFLAGVGEGFPKDGVVGVAAGIIADGSTDVGGNSVEIS